jgi:hypothetical protein
MDRTQISDFEQLQAQLQGLYEDVATLTKKKPDDAVNQFKLGLINQVLERANAILGDKGRPFDDFVRFDPDVTPTNSDVLVALSQYLNCLEKLRADNLDHDYRGWFWRVEGGGLRIVTAPPRKLKY